MEAFIGQILMFGGNFAPRGWALCDGQLLSISSNSALFAILGTTYGGDGRTTFALPDLRGRVAMHNGNGPGLSSRRLGEKSGTESNTLAQGNLPAHNHSVSALAKCKGGAGNANTAVGNVWSNDAGVSSATYSNSGADADMAAGAINVQEANVGSSQPVNNIQPFLVVNYIIALQGVFPSRN
jgi:microcystin-dependent protein